MNLKADELRALQKPFKDRYRENPSAARQTLQAEGFIDPDRITCRVKRPGGEVTAGLHPATGGSGEFACSAEMLLEALVSCAGVTLAAVATAMNVPLEAGTVFAEGDLDFRGTLGVSRDVPVGLTAIRLSFQLQTEAEPERVQKLVDLTERYCVVYQTLKHPPAMTVSFEIGRS